MHSSTLMRALRNGRFPARVPGVLVALTALVLAACGGGGGEEEPTATPETAATPTATREVTPERTPAATPTRAATPSPQAGAALNACDLLTKADAETALGEPVAPGDPASIKTREGGVVRCNYTATIPVYQVFLDALESPDEEDAAQKFQKARSAAEDAQPVSGIGDDAFWAPLFGELNVLIGNLRLVILVSLRDETAELDAAKAVAQAALGRLP